MSAHALQSDAAQATAGSSLWHLSIIEDKELVQVQMMATQAEAAVIEEALTKVLDVSYRADMGLKDFQIYRPNYVPDTASNLVETLVTATGAVDDPDQADLVEALRDRARNIDAAPDGEKKVFSLEFVWKNGGGDENAFMQPFACPDDASAEFQIDLETLLAHHAINGDVYWVSAPPADYEAERDAGEGLVEFVSHLAPYLSGPNNVERRAILTEAADQLGVGHLLRFEVEEAEADLDSPEP